jgi:hypothetical protein
MTASRRNKDQISETLFKDIYGERGLLELLNSDYMVFMIQFLVKLVEVCRRLRRAGAFGHEPKGGTIILRMAHQILARRSAEIFMARSVGIAHAKVTHEGFNARLESNFSVNSMRDASKNSPMQVESEIRLLYYGSIQMMEGHGSFVTTVPKHEDTLRPSRRVVQSLSSG